LLLSLLVGLVIGVAAGAVRTMFEGHRLNERGTDVGGLPKWITRHAPRRLARRA
jgi:hypothetical protein